MYFLLWLLACEITPFPNEQAKDYLENQAADFDGDGFTENMGDCDDVEDNIYPGPMKCVTAVTTTVTDK